MGFAIQSTTTADTANESWKAQGFLNFYLPSKAGGRRKLGAIPLKDSKVSERDLRAWLEQNPEHIKVLLSKLEVEYQSAEPKEGSAFDL